MTGRLRTFSAELGAEICSRIGSGESLRAICRDDGMPSEATVRGWVIDGVGDEFAAQYKRARDLLAFGWAEQLIEIADDRANDTYKDENGVVRVDHEAIARSRLRVDTRKWLLSKVLPKLYGDRITANIKAEISHDGDASQTPLQLAREIAFALRVGVIQAQAEAESEPS